MAIFCPTKMPNILPAVSKRDNCTLLISMPQSVYFHLTLMELYNSVPFHIRLHLFRK